MEKNFTYVLPNQEVSAAVLSPVRWFMTVALSLVLMLVTFWSLCLALYFSTWQQDTAPLMKMFQDALGDISPGRPLAHVAGIAQSMTAWLHQTLFVATGIESMPQAPVTTHAAPFSHAIDSLLSRAAPSFHVVITATQVFGLRLAMLFGMFPLALLAYVVAFVDGNAQRAIRRACAGRESATLYHRMKYLQFSSLGALLITTLCLPMHIEPLIQMTAFAVATTLLTRTQVTYYKKYG
ncbi:MAG: DUF4400 domain-containing protein [Rhizobacter sp.]